MTQKYRSTKQNARLSAWCKELKECELENGATEREAEQVVEELKERFSEQPVDNPFDTHTDPKVR